MNLQIGESLKLTRQLNQLNAKEAAVLLDISASYLSEIESGKKEPSLKILQKYSEVFDTKVSSIISLSESIEQIKTLTTVKARIAGYALKILYALVEEKPSEIKRLLV